MNDKIIIVYRVLWLASFGGTFVLTGNGYREAAIWLFVLGIYFIQKMNYYELNGTSSSLRGLPFA